jgi:hypothetical protein
VRKSGAKRPVKGKFRDENRAYEIKGLPVPKLSLALGVAARQKLAESEHVGELCQGEPLPLLDDQASRPGQRAAEAAEADDEKAGEQFEHGGVGPRFGHPGTD